MLNNGEPFNKLRVLAEESLLVFSNLDCGSTSNSSLVASDELRKKNPKIISLLVVSLKLQ